VIRQRESRAGHVRTAEKQQFANRMRVAAGRRIQQYMSSNVA